MRSTGTLAWIGAGLAAFALATAGCGGGSGNADGDGDGGSTGMDGSTNGMEGGTGGDGGSGGTGDGATSGDAGDGGWRGWGDAGCRQVTCQDHLYECGDCKDNDSNGDPDYLDPDCLGPCDNNEEGYHPDIPALAGQQCQLDCYYDQDQGPGNDTCEWDHRCDPKSPSSLARCAYQENPSGDVSCPDPQTESCHEFCDPLTPNGCDCFGCCTFPEIDGHVYVGSRDGDGNPTCTLDDVTNSDKCHPCTPVEDCYNDCKHCELCVGKSELPDDCRTSPPRDGGVDGGVDGGSARCPDGEQPCGLEGDDPCPPDTYCITGCCQTSTVF